MGNEFNPNLNIDDPLAEIIEAENTLREFGAASAGMEFQAEQNETQAEQNLQAEEAQQLTDHEQLLHNRIAELEAQLAAQKAANPTAASPATITATAIQDDCPEIVDAEPVFEEPAANDLGLDALASDDSISDDDLPDVDTDSFDSGPDDIVPDAIAPNDLVPDDIVPGQENAVADEEPRAAKIPMVTLEHHIPRPSSGSFWDTSSAEDVVRVKVPKADVFPNPTQPYTVAESAIVLPEGVTGGGDYQIASTRPMLSEDTVYVNWRQNAATRPNTFF